MFHPPWPSLISFHLSSSLTGKKKLTAFIFFLHQSNWCFASLVGSCITHLLFPDTFPKFLVNFISKQVQNCRNTFWSYYVFARINFYY